MALARLGRLLLATVFLVATQLALVHPLKHLKITPVEHAQCGGCIATASFGAAAASHLFLGASYSAPVVRSRAAELPFLAAFSPLFFSQAPPTLA